VLVLKLITIAMVRFWHKADVKVMAAGKSSQIKHNNPAVN